MTDSLKTLDDAMQALAQYVPAGGMRGVYTLDRMRALLMRLGMPQEAYPSVHIAGTSGKTSTAYFIRGLLEGAGVRTGLTVSPHIVSVTERVQIDGAPMADEQFVSSLDAFLREVVDFELKPTYFEVLMAFAYWVFRERKIDYAVVETGLGGLLDGSNTIDRPDKICVITDIGLDHTEVLGTTIREIARQKAGIIQAGNAVVLIEQSIEAQEEVLSYAADRGCQVVLVDPTLYGAPPELALYQHRNWAVAQATWGILANRLGRSSQVESVSPIDLQPPGRMECVSVEGRDVILDGAHNPQKLAALGSALRHRGALPTAALVNFMDAPSDKIAASFGEISRWAQAVVIPSFGQSQDLPRGCVSPRESARVATAMGIPEVLIVDDVAEGLAALLRREESLVVTGSLYLVSEVRKALLTRQS